MGLRLLTILILTIIPCFALSTTSCNSGPVGPKRTIPKFLSIKTSVSGLKDEAVLVTTRIYNTDNTGMGELKWNKAGNGPSEISIREPKEGHVYTIIAEAEGYTVQPESYRIRVIGNTAYIVSDNETGEEALHLDSHFTPESP